MLKRASSSARKSPNDFLIPLSSSAGAMIQQDSPRAWGTAALAAIPRKRGLLLGNHTSYVPIHFPETGVVKHLSGGDALLAIAIGKRTAKDLLGPFDDLFARRHDLIDDVLRHNGVAAANFGTAAGHARNRSVRVRRPVAGFNLFDLRNEVSIPHPDRGAQRCFRGELTQVAIVAGAVDATLLCHNLRGRRVDLLAEHVGSLVDNRGVG